MISYDYKSLFTNIPVVEVIEICLKVLCHSDLKHPQMPEFVCKEMLRMAVLGVVFSFDGIQTDRWSCNGFTLRSYLC